MHFFDLSRQINLHDLLIPNQSLNELAEQHWYLAKVRVDHDCLNDVDHVEGQVLLKSNHNIQIELEWLIQDTGFALELLFKGIETAENSETLVMIKGAHIVDENQHLISAQVLSLWIDGTLLPLLPDLRRDIKARLNLWDYVEYEG